MLQKVISVFKTFGLDWFQRASSQRFIPEIDALRFFAIIPVLLVHISGALLSHNVQFDREVIDQENLLRQILIQGNYGVHLFFAISGFILTLPFLNKKYSDINFKKYFIRRLVRIEPPYIIAITLFFLVHLYLNEESFSFLMDRYLASFFYLHNFIYETRSYILPVAWSLEIEVQFYLLMPLFLLVFKIFDSKYWRYLIYASLMILSFTVDFAPVDDLNDYMKFFLAGILAADLHNNSLFRRHLIWDILFLIALVGFFNTQDNVLRVFYLFFIVTSSLNAFYLQKFLSAKLITIIGGMCYTLYLLHYPLYHLMMKLFTNRMTFFESFEMNYLVQCLIFLPISILLMSIYFLVVEKPFMVLSQKISKTKRPINKPVLEVDKN